MLTSLQALVVDNAIRLVNNFWSVFNYARINNIAVVHSKSVIK